MTAITESPAPDRAERSPAAAWSALASAATVGVAADLLFRHAPERLSAALVAAVAIAAAASTATRAPAHQRRGLELLGGAAAALAALLVWRDSQALFALTLLALATAALLSLPRNRGGGFRRLPIGDGVYSGLELGVATLLGPIPLIGTVRDAHGDTIRRRSRWRAPLVGLLIAVPPLAVFAGLLASADPAFERALSTLLAWDIEELGSHLAAIGVGTWLTAGWLTAAFAAGEPAPRRTGGGFFTLEITWALGAIGGLFLAFVALQLRYLFGGADAVRAISGLTLAEYARRGFFELAWVATLAVLLLLVADWAVDHRDRASHRGARAASLAIIGLVFLMLGSALHRMELYTSVYGLTELRLYTSAFMLWVALTLGWFVATVARGRRWRFLPGVLVSGLTVLGALHLMNPDAVIIRVNGERTATTGRPFDAAYIANLSADAVPSLIDVLPSLPISSRCAAAHQMRDRWADWVTERRWTVAARRAARLHPAAERLWSDPLCWAAM